MVVLIMIELEIRDLQAKLNNLIKSGVALEQLYDLSVELDHLISKFYEQQNMKI